jgi:hypothetical protein
MASNDRVSNETDHLGRMQKEEVVDCLRTFVRIYLEETPGYHVSYAG